MRLRADLEPEEVRRAWTTIAGLAIGIPLGVAMQAMKAEPTAWLIVLAFATTVVMWPHDGWASTAVRRLVLAGLLWVVTLMGAFELLVTLSPPYTEDGHGLMPVGQTLGAFLIASVTALGAFVLLYRPLRTNRREDSAMLAIILAVTIVGWIVNAVT